MADLLSVGIRIARTDPALGVEILSTALDVLSKARRDTGKRRGPQRKRWKKKSPADRKKRKMWLRTPAGKKYVKRRKLMEKRPSTKRYRKRLRKKRPSRSYSWL